MLGNVRVTAAPVGDLAAGKAIALQGGVADFSQEGYPIVNAIDGDAKSGWAVMTQTGKPHMAIFETVEGLGTAAGSAVSLVLEQPYGGQHTLGRFRISVTTAPRPVKLDTLPVGRRRRTGGCCRQAHAGATNGACRHTIARKMRSGCA